MNRRSLLLAALIVSVSINLLILGATIGKNSRMQRQPGPPPLAWTAQSMPADMRDQVRRQMRERQPEVRQFREDMRAAMQAVRRAVSAEPGDSEALKNALAQLRAAQGDYQKFLHDSVADVAAVLPREQRIALLRQALERGERREDGKRPPHSPPER